MENPNGQYATLSGGGVIAGLGSVIFGKEIDSGENACISMGDPFCRFEIKGKQ